VPQGYLVIMELVIIIQAEKNQPKIFKPSQSFSAQSPFVQQQLITRLLSNSCWIRTKVSGESCVSCPPALDLRYVSAKFSLT
jgi:hypothetical protein